MLFRTRRRQAREQTGKMADHLEGLSSDDEETSTDITNFNLEKGIWNEFHCQFSLYLGAIFTMKWFIMKYHEFFNNGNNTLSQGLFSTNIINDIIP